MAVSEPGEARALDLEASALSPLAFATGRIGGQLVHWKDEGALQLYPGALFIVNGAGEGWEGQAGRARREGGPPRRGAHRGEGARLMGGDD